MSGELIELSADLAESNPDSDELGFAPLAQSIAKGICNMAPAEGITMAVTGGWGTGKTTMINFVRYYLKELGTGVEVVDFNPWWFSGHEDLVRKLLQQLATTVNPDSVAGKKLGGLLHNLAEVVDTLPVELKPSLFGFSIDLKKVATLSAEKMRQTKSVPELKKEIGSLLRELGIKFLVIVDDVDRLSVAEIRDLFRAVKAVGDLPNVIYLIAIDKDVVSKSLDDCFPERGAAYLDKIIQVSFDLPDPSDEGISNIFVSGLNRLLDSLKTADIDNSRFWTLYKGGVRKLLTTPRHAVRLLNALYVTIPGMIGEVNLADFIALESCRLFLSDVYSRIKLNKDKFSGHVSYLERRSRDDELKKYHEEWISSIPDIQQAWLKDFLMELFPKLNYAWRNTTYGADFASEWRRGLRACSPDIFDSYFRFSLSAENVSALAVRSFIQFANDGNAKELILRGVRSTNATEKNKFWALLDRLEDHIAIDITPEGCAVLFLNILEAWSEYVDIPGVKRRNWVFDNDLSIVRILFMSLKRCSPEKRMDLMKTAIERQLHPEIVGRLLANIGKKHGRFGGSSTGENEDLFTSEDYELLAKSFCSEIQKLADSEAISDTGALCRMVYFVAEMAPDKLELLVARLTHSTIGLISLISYGLQESTPIVTEEKSPRTKYIVNLKTISKIVEPSAIVDEIEKIVAANKIDERSAEIAQEFLAAYRQPAPNAPDLEDDETADSDMDSDDIKDFID